MGFLFLFFFSIHWYVSYLLFESFSLMWKEEEEKHVFFFTTVSRVGLGNPSPLGAGFGLNFLSPTSMGAGMGMLKLIPDPPRCHV